MKLTTIREIYKNREAYLDKEVTVGGWVRSVRDSKTFGFIVLHDGSYFETLQIVYHDEMETSLRFPNERRRSHHRKRYPRCYPAGKTAV